MENSASVDRSNAAGRIVPHDHAPKVAPVGRFELRIVLDAIHHNLGPPPAGQRRGFFPGGASNFRLLIENQASGEILQVTKTAAAPTPLQQTRRLAYA